MDRETISFENKFEVEVPVVWAEKPGPKDHLILARTNDELIIIKRTDIKLLGGASLDEYLNMLRKNAGRFLYSGNVEMSSVEPFETPLYAGRIMTYAFIFNNRDSETTIFAFGTEYFIYTLMLQTPANCSKEILNDYFDIVNSFRIVSESGK